MPDEITYTVAFFLAYFLPLVVAHFRGHRSILAIAFINVLFGWTILGWLIAMIWSLTGNVKEEVPARR